MPWRLKLWLIRRTRGSRSSGRRLRCEPCESLTTTSVAPPANAPRIAALASSAMSFRARPYSGCPADV